MAEKSELKRIPVFVDLPDDQISWFLGQTQELVLKPDDFYIHQGDPADAMYVILEGQLQARGEAAGQNRPDSHQGGGITGLLPLSRNKPFPIARRGIPAKPNLEIPSSLFPELIKRMPELTGRLVGLMSDRIREATR